MSAKDNIDKNAKSTFHGTSISVLQYITASNRGIDLPPIPSPDVLPSSNKLAPLPKEYTLIKPLPYKLGQNKTDIYVPLSNVNSIDDNSLQNYLNLCMSEEVEWLDNFDARPIDPSPDTKGWAQHHATKNENKKLYLE